MCLEVKHLAQPDNYLVVELGSEPGSGTKTRLLSHGGQERRQRSSIHKYLLYSIPYMGANKQDKEKRSVPGHEKLVRRQSPISQRRGGRNERTATTRDEQDAKGEQTAVGTRGEWDWAEEAWSAPSDRATPRSCDSGRRRLPGSQRERDSSLGKCSINYSSILELESTKEVHHFDNVISS